MLYGAYGYTGSLIAYEAKSRGHSPLLAGRSEEKLIPLAEELNLDYKTVRHHLDVLTKNNLLTFTGSKYGKMYFISPPLEESYEVFIEIWDKR